MRVLIFLALLAFLSSGIYSQVIPIQIEHDNTSGDDLMKDYNDQLIKIIDHYFSGNSAQLKKDSRSLLKSLSIANSEEEIDKNIYNIFIFDHNFDKISKGVSYLIGDGIGNPYQEHIFRIPNESRKLYEVIFYLSKYQVLSTYTFKRGESTFDDEVSKFAESVSAPIAGIITTPLDNKQRQDLLAKFTGQIPGANKDIQDLSTLTPSIYRNSIFNNLTDDEKITLEVDPLSRTISASDLAKAIEQLKKETTYKYSVEEVFFPVDIEGMDQSTLVVERVYLEMNNEKAKPFSHEATYGISGKKKWSFGLFTGAIIAFGGDNREKEVIEEGAVTEKEISRSMTMGIVSYSLGGVYKKKDLRDYSFFERTSVFGGFVITPEPGIGFGTSYDLFKKVSFNIGGAVLIVTKQETDASSSNLLKTVGRGSFFTGFSIKI